MTNEEARYCMRSYMPDTEGEYTHCTKCKYYGCNKHKTCNSGLAHKMAYDALDKINKIKKVLKEWNEDTKEIKSGDTYMCDIEDIITEEEIEDGNKN